jgi:alkylation response protein AidB-like acyl-CoA dehydrogenase
MNMELDEDQRAVLEAVESLLEKRAGAARAIELQREAGYDSELDAALTDSGFDEVFRADGMGALEAALVVEAVAYAGGVVAAGASTLVSPALCEQVLPGPIVLCDAGATVPVRFAAQARTALVLDGDIARSVPLAPGDAEPIASNFGFPMGRFSASLAGRGDSLGEGSGRALKNWWRLALAVEAVGCMRAALDQTTAYLKERRQFGKAIASFQAVQHRLAECAIAIQGSRWLVLETAYRGAPEEDVAAAASFAAATAETIFAETHQLSGAIGFTREHDLHVWSMRLQALRLELGGVAAHRRALAQARWGIGE